MVRTHLEFDFGDFGTCKIGRFTNAKSHSEIVHDDFLVLYDTRKCPLRGHILAPPEGLRAPELPGATLGVIPRSEGVINDNADEYWMPRIMVLARF